MNKIKEKIKFVSIITIISIIILTIIGTIVYASDFGSELMSISDNVSAQKGNVTRKKADRNRWGETITGQGVVDILNGKYSNTTNGSEAENFEIASGEGILNKYPNAYCARRQTGMSSAGEPTFTTQHTGTYNANNYINFNKSSSAPSFTGGSSIRDFLSTGQTETAETASNFNAIILWSGNLRSINNHYGKLINYETNIITYSHVYSDKFPGATYRETDAQNSVWGVTGSSPLYYPALFRAGKAVDEVENQIKSHPREINVTVNDAEHPGTVWLKDKQTYRVGPFHMEDYAYVYSEYVKPYSGKDLTISGINGGVGSRGEGFAAGIDGGSITLKDDSGATTTLNLFEQGPTIVFEDFYGNPTYKGDYTRHNDNNNTIAVPESEVVYPFPGAVFYIDIPRNVSNNATTLSDITFNFRETMTNGSGTVTIARYAKTAWKTVNEGASSCSYSSDHGNTESSGSDSTRNCHYHTGSGEDRECHDHDVYYYCKHHHTSCYDAHWDGSSTTTAYGQSLLIVENAEVIVDSTPYTTGVNIRLTTKISIKKYIKEIKHSTNGEVIFGDNVPTTILTSAQRPETRKKMTDSGRQADPVFVEYGDIIKYRIDVKNDQNYDVKVKLKDILPDKVKLIKRDFKNYEWLTVRALKELQLEVILITEANDGNLYVNEVKLVTKNNEIVKDTDENVDFIRTIDNRVGPVVNLNEIDTPDDIISREYHKINDYDLDIDKYITDYSHEMMDENNNNKITSENYNVQALKNNGRLDQVIERKKNYPVPVERTEHFVYSIRMTNNSVKTGVNKVATKVRPTEIIDVLDKGLQYVEIKGYIYDPNGNVKYTLVNGKDFSITEDTNQKNKFYIRLNNMQGQDYLVIEPNEYLIYEMKVKVVESNMRLEIMENVVNLSILSNINNGVTTDNISKAVGFTVDRPICPTCANSKIEIYYEKCPTCNGKGSISSNHKCDRCNGTGKVTKINKCPTCNGTGLVEGNCNHQGTDRSYKCNKCGRVTAAQDNTPAPTVCNNPIVQNICGSTSFTEKCTWCNRTKGNCTHYRYYCSGTNKHSHVEIQVGRGIPAPYRCTHQFNCDEYHEDEGLKSLYMASDGCESWSTGKCPHGNDYGLYQKVCNYCGARLDKDATSCPKYTYTYKCPDGCTITNNSSNYTGKCDAHSKDYSFNKKTCKKCGKNLTSKNGTCNTKVRCTQTNFTKKCYVNGSEHNLNNCNHYKFVCNWCGKEYNSKPASCTNGTIKLCGGTSFTETCMACNGTGKKKISCPSCSSRWNRNW